MNTPSDLPLLPFAAALYEAGGEITNGELRRVRLEAEREIDRIVREKKERGAR